MTGKNKYNNTRVTICGINFQSKGEGQYFLRLKDDLRKGEILGFKLQVPYKFIINGIYITKYVADFVVYECDGRKTVIDHKSAFTVTLPEYRMKKALMLACYGIAIKEVGIK